MGSVLIVKTPTGENNIFTAYIIYDVQHKHVQIIVKIAQNKAKIMIKKTIKYIRNILLRP